MKILKLSANNFLNLRAIDLTPNGKSLILSGKNGAGKSSILRAIQAGLGGKDASPEDPIRHGQKRAEIIVQTEKWTAKRVYTAKGERLELLSNDGAAYKSPQSLLDQVLGDISFDPLAFAKLDVPRQRGVVLRLAKLDFTQYDQHRAEAEEERKSVNRTVKSLKARIEATPTYPDDLPAAPIATKDLMDELSHCEAEAHAYQQALTRKSEAEADILDLQSRQEILEKELEVVRDQLVHAKSQLSGLAIPKDTFTERRAGVQQRLETMDQTNEAIRGRDARLALTKEYDEAQQQADVLTKQMDAIDEQKMKELMEATYPLDGLMLNDDAVLFNGTRLDQLSDGEAIRVSVAVAMALNPDLRVILIRNGSLLDEAGKAEIFQMAKDRDYQCWIEEVDESGTVGIYIEDGSVAAVDGVPVTAPAAEAEGEGIYD